LKIESGALKLFLVRHGQDHDNAQNLINGRRDAELTELGRAQALAAAEALQTAGIRRAYTSPLMRARQTASIIVQELGIPEADVDPDLIERDYGVLTGKPPADIPEYATNMLQYETFKYVIAAPGIEDYSDLWNRAGNVLRRIRQRHAGETVLIVAHNEIIKMIRANFAGRGWEDELRLPPLANGQVIPLG
jgi:broad specificity phosphatase PhoE